MRVPVLPTAGSTRHALELGQVVGIEVHRDRGDFVQSLGIEPFSPPGGQGLEY
jgi:hypothetical protein